MAVTWETAENGRVFVVKFFDPWASRDMNPAFQADLIHRDAFIRTHPGKQVHLLVDMTQSKLTPSGALLGLRTPSLSHPTRGHIVIVNPAPTLRYIILTIMKLSRYDQFTFVTTLDEGWALLRRMLNDEEAV
jgi:hypothetical protein